MLKGFLMTKNDDNVVTISDEIEAVADEGISLKEAIEIFKATSTKLTNFDHSGS